MLRFEFVSTTIEPTDRGEAAYWFVYQAGKLLVQSKADQTTVPLISDPGTLDMPIIRHQYLGYLEQASGRRIHCYSAEAEPDSPLPAGFRADSLRQLYGRLSEELFMLAGRAVQVMDWDRTHLFCGRCGEPTETLAHERAKRCPHCGLTSYPRLSPAIIIAVTREMDEGRRLLLARNHRFPDGFYSVIAGFVEPGETLEACAAREVEEEVGIRIKHIRYFGSQPWPFPNSLMIGFTAEFDGGDIRLEEAEIADAGWFGIEALPDLPPPISIARRLIDNFVAETERQESD